MLYQFDTDDVRHARAAMLLYAMYRSRKPSSSLNGMETWDRCNSYIRGAWLKSRTTAEFVQNFCKKADIGSIKPCYFDSGDPVLIPETGELISGAGIKNYRLEIIGDNSLLDLFANEALYIIMLVRERIQREKLAGVEETNDENED